MYGRRDPIPRVDGNMFSYAGGNPVMAADPLGSFGMGVNPFGGHYASPRTNQLTGQGLNALADWHYGPSLQDKVEGMAIDTLLTIAGGLLAKAGGAAGAALKKALPSLWDEAMWAAKEAAMAADDACENLGRFPGLVADAFPNGGKAYKGNRSDLIYEPNVEPGDVPLKIRFDISDPSPHNSPHVDFEKFINGLWKGDGKVFPRDVPPG